MQYVHQDRGCVGVSKRGLKIPGSYENTAKAL